MKYYAMYKRNVCNTRCVMTDKEIAQQHPDPFGDSFEIESGPYETHEEAHRAVAHNVVKMLGLK